mmetsp:Transcript_38433/g.92651  ORF Transcript_38433/g.92651 Transcript_38433/m.92651 type:complete len:323 (-) Transcript_38433:214-1182(-)|eukprot:CAMPEP_0181088184 /NCGR_PEP_ID=MMETSP1071-20121207/6653_1 /TAXON_ID=35127 /ORGANISM="Thalassiosira sp., Strain NH16" /LENGTH=322 /DNA_ID=CAMNT_0023170087 /DNA_START=22 /DNA_END=990 /DNA_ORIENTATION=+
MVRTFRLVLSLCLAASPSLSFKATSHVKSSATTKVNPAAGGDAYRRQRRRPRDDGAARSRSPISIRQESSCTVRLAAEEDDESSSTATAISDDGVERRFSAASTEKAEIVIPSGEDEDVVSAVSTSATSSKAATSTVNERLLSEIQASVQKEKYGKSGGKGREYFKEFQSSRTEEERMRSIEEARDLNGVNPLVCIGGAAFAWACAGGLWVFTTYLGVLFTTHPLDTDVYFVQRLTSVFRNVVMGLSSLASGFFGVVGIGIFLLGVRVAYGVMTGELDPTPIKMSKSEEIVLPDVWGLMMGKKPNRRGKRGLGGGDDNPYGL